MRAIDWVGRGLELRIGLGGMRTMDWVGRDEIYELGWSG